MASRKEVVRKALAHKWVQDAILILVLNMGNHQNPKRTKQEIQEALSAYAQKAGLMALGGKLVAPNTTTQKGRVAFIHQTRRKMERSGTFSLCDRTKLRLKKSFLVEPSDLTLFFLEKGLLDVAEEIGLVAQMIALDLDPKLLDPPKEESRKAFVQHVAQLAEHGASIVPIAVTA